MVEFREYRPYSSQLPPGSSQRGSYLSMNDDQRQPMPLVLTGQQREVLEALRDKETEEYPLSNWYLGALYALDNHYNPDRISQAAQSLRELLEKLPRARSGNGWPRQSASISKKCDANYTNRFSKDKKRYKGEWKGKIINAGLDKTLEETRRIP